ncbi:HEAT repeat domain-containing protein [bacterium]|nr:HEAT repeat domain-containing protein [bacterium]
MNKKRIVWILSVIFMFVSLSDKLGAQTSSSSRRRSSSSSGIGSSSSSSSSGTSNERASIVTDLLVAYVIGGMLRNPDSNVRKQAIQSLAKGLSSTNTSSSSSSSSTSTSGVRERLFGTGSSSSSSSSSSSDSSSGLGPMIYIPDLYVLLADPDPEVKDLASAGLDLIMGTEVTILRLMNDPEPLIRNYATKIYATRIFANAQSSGTSRSSSTTEGEGDISELFALRTMLVRLKYESNVEVRKTIKDAIEWYITKGASDTSGGRGGRESDIFSGMFGVDPNVLKFLDDPDPELRKNAIRVVSSAETNYDVLIMFMERLKTETDDGVRQELQTAIDNFVRSSLDSQRGRRGDRRSQPAPAPAAPARTPETPNWTLE